MIYKWLYKTPEGFDDILMNSDSEYLTGLWFVGSKDSNKNTVDCIEKNLPIFEETTRWLDIYFSGKNPDFTPKYKIKNLTPFRMQVTDIMNDIPYGKTICYGDIAKKIAEKRNIKKMSSQAVGNAVGSNCICIIIPCHRVIGVNNKIALLNHEKNSSR